MSTGNKPKTKQAIAQGRIRLYVQLLDVRKSDQMMRAYMAMKASPLLTPKKNKQ